MKILVTGSAGHLGEALVRTITQSHDEAIGIDLQASNTTQRVGSICNQDFVRECMLGVDAVIHTATLHKPHVGTHSRQDFIDTNISGTLNLLEEASRVGCKAFIYTSTTSTFGDAMRPAKGQPAVWVTESLHPKPKNIYGVTKTSAEDLCQLFHRNTELPCVVLRTSRFFPEMDDNKGKRDAFEDDNLKVNELLFRRADIEDIVTAHLAAIDKAADIGFERLIVTATTPFRRNHVEQLGVDAPSVLEHCVPSYVEEYVRRGWKMFPNIGRVYDNSKARELLSWEPKYNFEYAINQLSQDKDYRSQLAQDVGAKGYHGSEFKNGIYPLGNFESDN